MITGSTFHLDAVGTTSGKISHQTVSPVDELPLFRIRQQVKRAVDETGQRLEYLISILHDARWHTARELKVYGFNDRELRELVESSDGQIFSFPGSPGYKLFDFVAEEEFVQCASLKHQAERMLARYSRYQSRHHRGK